MSKNDEFVKGKNYLVDNSLTKSVYASTWMSEILSINLSCWYYYIIKQSSV